MGGSSKKQTVGYRYSLGAHLALCHGPVDAIREIRVDDRTAWSIATGAARSGKGTGAGAETLLGTVAGMSAATGSEGDLARASFPGSLAGIRLGQSYALALADGSTRTVTVRSVAYDGDNGITTWLVEPVSLAFAAQSVTVKEAGTATTTGSTSTGGGFDQGLRFGRGLIARDFEVIAPSRFGYLRSDFPADASPANQADAFAELLDHLKIDRLPVAGGSAGALPAAQFALRHPDRCSELVLLVPAMNLTGEDPVQFTALQRFFVDRLLSSDAWFWTMLKLAPRQLIGTLLATDPSLLETVSADERERAFLILAELMPINQRSRGMLNDGRYSGRPADIDLPAIATPMLVVSAEDDRFGTAETARTIAERAPSGQLVMYPSGGHIWLGHNEEIADEIAGFVRKRGS
jgi:pimeloyl-ACP methyl ester carboxylesterase